MKHSDLQHLVRISILLVGLSLYFFIYDGTNWIYFFSVLIASVIIPKLIPNKKEKQQSKKATKPKKKPSTSIYKKLTEKKRTDKELLKTKIDEMTGEEFERICAMYFNDNGYNPKITGGSGDHGVDIVMTDPKEKYKIAVQCKRHKKSIGNGPIIIIDGGKRFYDCIEGWVITTSYFTPKAKEFAEKRRVKLLNGLYVQETIGQWQKNKL